MKAPEGFESKADHAAWLGVTERSIDRWCDEPDGLTHTRVGRWKIFKREWTLAWLEARKTARNPTTTARRRGQPRGPTVRREQHRSEARSGP
jgi:hypothetical protein